MTTPSPSFFIQLLEVVGGTGKTQASYRLMVLLAVLGGFAYQYWVVTPTLDAVAAIGSKNSDQLGEVKDRLTRLEATSKAEARSRDGGLAELRATTERHTVDINKLSSEYAADHASLESVLHPPALYDWRHGR
ncbi:MAG: hypothetical protein ACREFC_13890 [Stellaceae bacterium]